MLPRDLFSPAIWSSPRFISAILIVTSMFSPLYLPSHSSRNRTDSLLANIAGKVSVSGTCIGLRNLGLRFNQM